MLEGMHYSQSKLDDKLSATVYTRYLESIDSQHTSLLASDVADFEQYKLRFDDMIRSGDVDPAFAIFARFQQRNRERIKFAISQLDKEPDWTLNESFEFNREKAPWAAAPAELDEFWRKRVKNDALSLLLTGKAPVINGDGKQTRDYVYVGDVVAANVAALDSDFIGPVNIGTGVEADVLTIYNHLRDAVGSQLQAQHGPAKAGEQRRSCIDNRRAGEVLGWRPQVALPDGLQRTAAYYRDHLAQ